MKKCKCIFQKRIFPFVTVFLVVLSVLVFSAPRAEAIVYDYNDYIQSIKVDGDNDIVTVSLPLDNLVIEFYSGGDYVLVANGESIDLSNYFSNLSDLTCSIFFTLAYIQNNIPVDTVLTVDFSLSDSFVGYDTPYCNMRIFYYDSVFNNIGDELFQHVGQYPIADISVSGTLTNSFNFSYFRPVVYFNSLGFSGYSTAGSVTCHSITLSMSISSLYRLQQEVGETNEILEAVKAELIDQGTTLDAVLTKLGVIEGKIDSGLSWLQSIYTTLQNIFSGIQSLVSSLGSSIGSGIQQITSGVASLVTGQQQTNSDLDEIINGGEIVDPGVSDAVDQFDDQISGVTDFENQVQNDFSQQFDAVLADFDGIGDLGPAFNFLGGYAGTLFVSLQDYSFIIILPIMIGVFMAICQHFPRGSLRGRSYSEHVSFSQSELQSHRDAQSELASTRSWVDRDS